MLLVSSPTKEHIILCSINAHLLKRSNFSQSSPCLDWNAKHIVLTPSSAIQAAMPNPVRPNHHRFTSESSHAYRESRLLENFISWIINFATLEWFRTRCPGSLCITWTTHVFRLLLEEAPNVIRTKTANGTHTHIGIQCCLVCILSQRLQPYSRG